MERLGASIKGIYRDVLKDQENTILYDSGYVANTIVDDCRILLAGFMKNAPGAGIQRLSVGQGEEAWDTRPAPALPTTRQLVTPYEPPLDVKDLELTYLDAHDQPATADTGATPRLQITATLQPGYPAPLPGLGAYPLREFGLFGRLDTTYYLINCVRHPVIHKETGATLIRSIRLYF